MKKIKLIFLMIFLGLNYNIIAQNFKAFSTIDASNALIDADIFDYDLPNQINKDLGIKKSLYCIDNYKRKFLLEKYYKKGTLLKSKIIYGKGSPFNLQIFYKKVNDYYLGVAFYAKGDNTDDKSYTNIPFIGSQFNSLIITNKSEENIMLIFGGGDTLSTLKSVIYDKHPIIMNLDKYFRPFNIITSCNTNSYTSRSLVSNSAPMNIDFDNLYNYDYTKTYNLNFLENSNSLKLFFELKNIPIVNWNWKLFCR